MRFQAAANSSAARMTPSLPMHPPPAPPDPPDTSTPPRRATMREVIGAVFWSFFGIRKGDAMRRDAVTIKPHQVIVVGILLAAVLVATLLILVRMITRGV
jgi:hypothetical protein